MTPEPRARPGAAALIRAGIAVPAAPWTRYRLSLEAWAELADRLLSDPLPLITLWSDGEAVHALFLEGGDAPLVASVAIEARRYLALSPARPAMASCERIVRDLWGVEAMHARDLRPWLDHGMWGLTAPLAAKPGPAAWPPEPFEFLSTPGDEAIGAFQLGVGPVQALTSGPALLRLTLDGERIERLELLLGHAHRGVLQLMRGRAPADAAPLAARIDAETGIAHQSAFARAVEAAQGWRIPLRAEGLRSAMAELERIALHLQHLGRAARAVGMDATVLTAARLREAILLACADTFGHRLMMDAIVPGGLARLPAEAGLASLPRVLDRIEAALPALARALFEGAGARLLAGRAPLPAAIASRFLVGGPAGRASERSSGARPGDAADRCRVRLDEIGRGLAIIRRLLLADPAGPVRCDPPLVEPGAAAGGLEGIGMAESAHGPVWYWVRLEAGKLSALHAHDPSLPLWLALEQAAVGLERDELALLCASLGLSASGADQ